MSDDKQPTPRRIVRRDYCTATLAIGGCGFVTRAWCEQCAYYRKPETTNATED